MLWYYSRRTCRALQHALDPPAGRICDHWNAAQSTARSGKPEVPHPRGTASVIGRVIAFLQLSWVGRTGCRPSGSLSSSSMQYQMPIRDARQRPSEKQRVGERSARASSMLHFHNAKSFCINGIGFCSCSLATIGGSVWSGASCWPARTGQSPSPQAPESCPATSRTRRH